jgi:hypothetical protein
LAIVVGGVLYVALYELSEILGFLADHTTFTTWAVRGLTAWFVYNKVAAIALAIAESRLWKTKVIVFFWTRAQTAATKAHVFWLTLDWIRTNLWIRSQLFAISVIIVQSGMLIRNAALWAVLTGLRLISTAVTWLLVAAQWALNIAVYAFPGTWLALAILAVVLAVYYMITHWKETKAVLMDLWDWVKSNWPYLAAAMLGPLVFAAYWAIKHWDTVKGWFGSFFDWIVEKAKWAGGEVASALNPLNWGPGIPGFDLGDVPGALGGVFGSGGTTAAAALPTGSRVSSSGQQTLTYALARSGERQVHETRVYLNRREIARAVEKDQDDRAARR